MTTFLTGTIATSVRAIDDLSQQLGQRGWHVGVVSGGTSLREALDALGAALDFPDYYGRNLDALEDCLRDVERPTALLWAGWEPLAVHAPDAWAALQAVLKRRVEADLEPFSVVYCVNQED